MKWNKRLMIRGPLVFHGIVLTPLPRAGNKKDHGRDTFFRTLDGFWPVCVCVCLDKRFPQPHSRTHQKRPHHGGVRLLLPPSPYFRVRNPNKKTLLALRIKIISRVCTLISPSSTVYHRIFKSKRGLHPFSATHIQSGVKQKIGKGESLVWYIYIYLQCYTYHPCVTHIIRAPHIIQCYTYHPCVNA